MVRAAWPTSRRMIRRSSGPVLDTRGESNAQIAINDRGAFARPASRRRGAGGRPVLYAAQSCLGRSGNGGSHGPGADQRLGPGGIRELPLVDIQQRKRHVDALQRQHGREDPSDESSVSVRHRSRSADRYRVQRRSGIRRDRSGERSQGAGAVHLRERGRLDFRLESHGSAARPAAAARVEPGDHRDTAVRRQHLQGTRHREHQSGRRER